MRDTSPVLPLPLYHGTSTLFLDGIVEKGLAAANPLADWKVLECAREIYPLVAKYLANTDDFMAKADSFRRMTEQSSRAWNFQHGNTYVSPSTITAVGYAASMRYGSELLTYTLDFLRELLNRDVRGVKDDLYRRFPEIFYKLDISVAPILIRIDNIPTSALFSESGGDPTSVLESLLKVYVDSPESMDLICQQHNFRLRTPIPPSQLSVWLINVSRFDPFKPEYVLYPLGLLRHSKPISEDKQTQQTSAAAPQPSQAHGSASIPSVK